jgi:hypothetical protein
VHCWRHDFLLSTAAADHLVIMTRVAICALVALTTLLLPELTQSFVRHFPSNNPFVTSPSQQPHQHQPVSAIRDYSEPELSSMELLSAGAVEAGTLMVAPKHEYNHFLMEQAVLVYEADETGYRGVILEMPTAFTVDEMVPGLDDFDGNYLFTGGEDGGRSVIMVHPHGEELAADGQKKKSSDAADAAVKFNTTIANCMPIGGGLFVGGVEEAKAAVAKGLLPAGDFKFFFNHVRWSTQEVPPMLEEGGWRAVKLPDSETPKFVLRNGDHDLWRAMQRELGVHFEDDGETNWDEEAGEPKEVTINMERWSDSQR